MCAMSEEEATMLAVYGIAFTVGLAISLLIQAVICYFLHQAAKGVPESHQRQAPGLVWLLMIPCFNIIWNFFVFPGIAEGYRDCLSAKGDGSPAALPVTLGWSYAGCVAAASVLGLIPCLGIIISGVGSLAALVVLIIYLVKVFELKRMVAGGV